MTKDSRTKAQIIDEAKRLDERRQGQISRQIDSITRLLALQDEDETERVIKEITWLNTELGERDHRIEELERMGRRLRQSIVDRRNAGSLLSEERGYLGRLLTILDEAGITSYDDKHGSTSEGDRTAEDEDPTVSTEQLAD